MSRLFISYARSDLQVVQVLVSALRSLGHDVFYDQDLTGGKNWWETVLDSIEEADAFVPILSDSYRQSESCTREAGWADALAIPFMPIGLGSINPGLLSPAIAEANWIQYSSDSPDWLVRLARAFQALPPARRADPLPDRPDFPSTHPPSEEAASRAASAPGRQGIFVSYRRSDTKDVAGRLYDRLCADFGEDIVFTDVDSIDLGSDFEEALDNAILNCAVCLVLIGERWLEIPTGRVTPRIFDENDFVRIEIKSALDQGITVIPVLVDGAPMPVPSHLPEDISRLTKRQAGVLRYESFRSDAQRLVAALRRRMAV